MKRMQRKDIDVKKFERQEEEEGVKSNGGSKKRGSSSISIEWPHFLSR